MPRLATASASETTATIVTNGLLKSVRRASLRFIMVKE